MEVDAGAQSLWANPVAVLFAAIAVIAFVYAVVSALKAWSLSYGHADFDRLGLKKWVMGTLVIAHMPAAAIPFVWRYFAGFVVFMLALVALAVYAATSAGGLP